LDSFAIIRAKQIQLRRRSEFFAVFSRSARWRADWRTFAFGREFGFFELRNIPWPRTNTIFGTPARRATWMP